MKNRIQGRAFCGLTLAALIMNGCSTVQPQATAAVTTDSFAESYEALNGTINASGKENRTIHLPADHPFVEVSGEDIVTKAEAKETFYVLYSDAMCPWCRSVIETAAACAKKNGISTIYVVDLWDDEGNEVFRDKVEVKDGVLTQTVKGTDAYAMTLTLFQNVLNEYTVTDVNGTKYDVGEKRIFAPNFIYVKDGQPVVLTEGISELQTDAREELSDAILQDEQKILNTFFQTK